MTSAARRASLASSSVQQPRAPVRYDCGFCDSARWTPVTSCPASTARAAAIAESTPPHMAASTLSPITTQITGAGSCHRATLPGRPAGAGTASPMQAPRASMSAWVEVWPSEKRSEPRARASSAPIASRT